MPRNSRDDGIELRGARARLGEELRRAFDGAERVFDLVREPRGHLADGGEPIALLHPLVDERVLDDDADLRGEALEQRHLFVRIRVAHAIVGDDQAGRRARPTRRGCR